MDRLDIDGGRPLRGHVLISGAKNAALPAMAAALLTTERCRLHRVPHVRDVGTMRQLLATLGVDASPLAGDALTLHVRDETNVAADYQMVRRMRASICVLGPLLARRRRARVALPGGCQIGHRPVDVHLRALAELGADIRLERGDIVAEASHLVGRQLSLAGPLGSTVTGTCNVMAAATLAHGRSVLTDAAREPEVADFGRLLTAMGARIDGLGTDVVTVEGVTELGGYDHTIIADRIEAATLAAAAAIVPGSRLTLGPLAAGDVTAAHEALTQLGHRSTLTADSWTIAHHPAAQACETRFATAPHPGLPTDWQAQLTAVLSQTPGTHRVVDAVFPERFGSTGELVRMGAAIERTSDGVLVTGPAPLVGCDVLASDLRASAALVLAGLAADGRTRVRRIYHLDRGYEALETKLAAVGAAITRVRDEHAF